MTRAELKKVKVMEKIMDGHMTNAEGAASLGLSTRQVIRLKKTHRAKGEEGIAHQNRGRKPAHDIDGGHKGARSEVIHNQLPRKQQLSFYIITGGARGYSTQ